MEVFGRDPVNIDFAVLKHKFHKTVEVQYMDSNDHPSQATVFV